MKIFPLVSVICPLYNKKSYIKETIDSVINQTYTNWEMIIVDDGSTDGSYELVESVYKDYDRIRLYNRKDFKQHKGVGVCRNIGIELAKSEFILFLDADDLLADRCLENRIRIQSHFPEKDMYVFPELYFKDNVRNVVKGGAWNRLDKVLYLCSFNKKEYFLKRFLKYYLPWTILNVLWKRTTLMKLGGFDEQFHYLEDPELHTRALLQENIKVKDFLFSQRPDVFIRLDEQRHRDSIGSQKEKYLSFVKSSEQFVSKFKKEIQKKGNYKYLLWLNVHLMLIEITVNNAFISCEPDDKAYYRDLKVEIKKFRASQSLHLGRITQGLVNLHEHLVQKKILRKMKIPAIIALVIVYSGIYFEAKSLP